MEKEKRGQRYDEAFKREAVALVVEQKIPVSRAAQQTGVNADTLNKWVVQSGLREVDTADKSDKEIIRELDRKLRQVTMERNILKEAVGIFTARPK